MVISLTAKGLTTGEVSAHMAEVYGTEVPKDTISRTTDKILAEMSDWQNRPLDRVYPVVFIDAMVVKIRDGQVKNRLLYTAIGVTVDGERDILGLWVGNGGEGAKFWLQVLTEIKNRRVEDVCVVVCDGLKGLPEAISDTWPLAIVQTCVLHLIRNTFRFTSKASWDKIARDLRPVYTAVSEHNAKERFVAFAETWGDKYPAIIWLWENAWVEFFPFLDYLVEIRKVIYSTDVIVNPFGQVSWFASGRQRSRRHVRRVQRVDFLGVGSPCRCSRGRIRVERSGSGTRRRVRGCVVCGR